MLLRDVSKDEEEIKTVKIDKDVKTSFVSVADYTKVYKYKKPGAFNSSLLNLEYDNNGVLISSKATDESKVVPFIISSISGIASIITAGKAKALIPAVDDGKDIVGQCLTISKKELHGIDDIIAEYSNYNKNSIAPTEKQFVTGKAKYEEEILKEFSELFYAKEIRMIPAELIFIIPESMNPTTKTYTSINLFSLEKGKIKINDSYKEFYLYTPDDRFEPTDTFTNPYKLQTAIVSAKFDRNESLASFLGAAPNKITAVYNIPKTERVRIQKPTVTETLIDTSIKIPQHGVLGYYSMKLSTADLTYDANGELKKISLERKSVLDASATSAGTAAKDMVTALKKEKDKTELELLDDQAKKLELLKKIHDLEHATD
jgi:hypothetical protein